MSPPGDIIKEFQQPTAQDEKYIRLNSLRGGGPLPLLPSGATTGKVVVTTPGGTLTSNVNFRIIQ
jgi:hypothetical protein